MSDIIGPHTIAAVGHDPTVPGNNAAAVWLDDLSVRVLGGLLRSLAVDAAEPAAGERFGRYRLEAELGRGGMGVVFSAYDERLDRRVALKFLNGPSWARRGDPVRLLDEARAAARLDHPGIAVIHEVGETPEGRPFIVMAHYGDRTVEDRLKEGPLSTEEALDVARQVADALAAAHRAGVVHRDVKPSNVVLAPGGRVRVVDFGIAGNTGLRIGSGPAVGTVPYMSPEQVEGAQADPRTDVWSMGVLIYELLAHQRPFRGDDRQSLVDAIRTADPLPLETLRPDTPPELTAVVERCLRKRPQDRYASAEGVHAALSALVPGWPGRGDRATPGGARAAAEASYRKGRHFLDSGDIASVRKGLDAFRAALDHDPDFALAWCGVSDAYESLAYWAALPPEEAHPRARAAAERALELEPELAAAHTSLATVLLDYHHDWDTARQHYELALHLDPSYAVGHQLYAELLRDQGRFDEALAEIDEAIRLDPLAPYFRLIRGVVLHMARRHEEALAAFDALLQATPDYPAAHFYIGLTCASAGKLDRALDALRAMDPSAASPDTISVRGAALARAGRSTEANEALRSLASVDAAYHAFPFHQALIRLNLGEVESGITRLEEDADRRTWFSRIMGVEPLLDPARGHPRFEALLERVGIRGP